MSGESVATNNLRDWYGTCELGKDCMCLRGVWRGRLCKYWHPLGPSTFAELKERFNEIHRRTGLDPADKYLPQGRWGPGGRKEGAGG